MTALALSVFAAGAALTDVRNNKIYNWYLVPGLIAGIVTRLVTEGAAGVREALCSITVTFFLMCVVYAFRGLAAGDVKLMTALAAFFTLRESVLLIGVSFLLTAVYGIARIIVKRTLTGRIHFAVPVWIGVMILQTGGFA